LLLEHPSLTIIGRPSFDTIIFYSTFKTKLIKVITEKMGAMVKLSGKQRLIVDFIGDPIEYSTKPGGMAMNGTDTPCFARHMLGFAPVGEADCKFPR